MSDLERYDSRTEELARLEDVKELGRDLAIDLIAALNLIRLYQRAYAMMNLPDPHRYDADKLFRKYKQATESRESPYKIFADGREIGEHPDSIPGTVTEILEITEAEVVLEIEAGD